MKVLSLFDGMACGALALQAAGIEIESYDAFEIDKYAIKTASHNFPFIKHNGDVFAADFTQFKGVDLVCGGSPCTYWSIAQKNNRETEASGMGWELFQQYCRAIKEAQPKFFIYENNKSMSKAIRKSIDEAFGFEAVLINSALVSAQNRQRLYWVGRRNPDGTYSKVSVEQPIDRGILLKDVLDDNCFVDREKAHCLKHQAGNARDYFKKHHTQIKFEPVGIGYRGRMEDGKWVKRYESNGESKANAITTAQTDSMLAEPVGTTKDGKSYCLTSGYANGSGENIGNYVAHTLEKGCKSMVSEPVRIGTYPNEAKNQDKHDSQQYRIYSADGKSVALCGNGGGLGAKTGLYAVPLKVGEVNGGGQGNRIYSAEGKAVSQTATSGGVGSNTGLYAIPVEFDGDIPTKAISAADGKTYRVHKVENGLITIKGKQYPIKLADGYYIIRKLTVSECKRLQTVPEWYEFPVSDSQAYKMLGNGWTVEVIAHLLKSCLSGKVDVQPQFGEQMRFF